MKTCPRCKIEKDNSEFAWKDKRAGKLAVYCRPCQKEYRAAHHKKNGALQRSKIVLRKQNIKAHFQTIKQRLSCLQCGESHPATLDFHHRDPNNKEMNVAKLICNARSIARINEEIEKCDILCANCHRKFHWKEKQQKQLDDKT